MDWRSMKRLGLRAGLLGVLAWVLGLATAPLLGFLGELQGSLTMFPAELLALGELAVEVGPMLAVGGGLLAGASALAAIPGEREACRLVDESVPAKDSGLPPGCSEERVPAPSWDPLDGFEEPKG